MDVENSVSSIVRVGVVIIAVVGFGAIIYGLSIIFKDWLVVKAYKVKHWFRIFKQKIKILKRFYKELKKDYSSYSVEVVFNLFVYFYENYFSGWETPKDEYFPNGKIDLMNMYKWIKKIRKENYNEIKNLDFDDKNKYFIYWGSKYQSLKHKITNDGVLKIFPIEYVESEHPDIIFQKHVVAIQEDLFTLDTEKCKWIIDRRKQLML